MRSIQKILLGLDDFYSDIVPDHEYDGEESDIVHCQIRNGWLYDTVAHAEQAIEGLFLKPYTTSGFTYLCFK